MTEKAAEIFDRGRRSATGPEEAWQRLEELGTEAEWTTEWLRSYSDRRVEREWRYEHE